MSARSGLRVRRGAVRERERLAGVVIGEIRVLARCEDRELSSGAMVEQWLCRCKCGALQKRTRSNIVASLRHGKNMACYQCNRELRAGLREWRRQVRSWVYRSWWSDFGTLYLESVIDEAAPSVLAPSILAAAEAAQTCQAGSHQRMAYLYPINLPADRMIACCHCGSWVRDFFGCVQCLSPVCIACAAREAHKHSDLDTRTLVDAGEVFGLSKERTRRIEMKAVQTIRARLTTKLGGRRAVGMNRLAAADDKRTVDPVHDPWKLPGQKKARMVLLPRAASTALRVTRPAPLRPCASAVPVCTRNSAWFWPLPPPPRPDPSRPILPRWLGRSRNATSPSHAARRCALPAGGLSATTSPEP